jgi:MraZ protein
MRGGQPMFRPEIAIYFWNLLRSSDRTGGTSAVPGGNHSLSLKAVNRPSAASFVASVFAQAASVDDHSVPWYPIISHFGLGLRPRLSRRRASPKRRTGRASSLRPPLVAGRNRAIPELTPRMDRFVSSLTLRLDAKGRVSVPAAFRAVLARDGFEGLYCYPSIDQPALDAGGHALLREIEELIGRYLPYSEPRDQLALALYGTSETLKIDAEGRVTLPETLKAHAGITQAVAFVGLGHKFQIWEPDRFRAQLAEATEKVRTVKRQLGSQVSVPGVGARE